MRSEDIPIIPRSRALILRYEQDRPVIEAAARDALVRDGLEGDRDVPAVVLHPYDASQAVREQRPQDWVWAFDENERFAAALVQKEAALGIDHLPVHVFGCAPLALVLHLASCLPRRPLRVYQQAPDGTWSLGHDNSQAPSPEDFFQVEGLPAARQGGRGHVALVVEVTRSIRDEALEELRARHGAQLLATVCLRPVAGPSPTSVRGPGDTARAAAQFRAVLDSLHERLGGAESVLLAMDCPVSFAAALGSAINLNTQHPLRLHHFDARAEPGERYVPVHLLNARRSAAATREPTRDEEREATRVLGEVRRVHRELVAWLKEPAQQALVEQMDGQGLLRSEVEDAPAVVPTPVYRHLMARWSFEVGLLLNLGALRARLGSQEDWKECVRLFLIHEAYHVRQRGLTSYNYSGSGRTGFVLEAVDYDADAVAVEAALAWREAKQAGMVSDDGRAKTREAIIWNALESLRIFEQERPVRDFSERRLRRYLIWLFHVCRLSILARTGSAGDAGLAPVTIEIAGLPAFPDPHERYSQRRVRLEVADSREPLELAVYFQRRLVRESNERDWVVRLLEALGHWDERPLEEAREAMRLHFERFFDRHPELLRP
ncbi:SAVED domain-containing protein [Myxococcus sp. RHSTA-1-4]|uniref:SAVED domain-containing protein n=1 Tax=Myxococcus sp. RHSTA-1-4 TaxID=2874601 RepID=UPI001CBEF07D|nr:SAVED domain-containing protein [Myxococcus sp. RHSTA-1-4]MBZ4423275.1 SAVED domain-containing protein [Myxococcus sp. RHSTA-1-4]